MACDFEIQNPGSGGGGGDQGIFAYHYGLKWTISCPIYLRREGVAAKGDECGIFSNLDPDVIPQDCLLSRVAAFNNTLETDEWDLEVYRDGILVYTLTKPAGFSQAIDNAVLIAFTAGQTVSVRANDVASGITNPRATLVFAV